MKDNFSLQAGQYAKYRPTYPQALYHFLISLVKNRQTAWDCGTGNGQVASELANYFQQVYGTDISEKQIRNAQPAHNIIYKVESAETTSFPDAYFDLITVAQAVHWFHFDDFYSEVKRTLKPDGVLAVIGYGLMKTEGKVDAVIEYFYHHVVGKYWDEERKYLEENYETIPFPFEEIEAPIFCSEFEWTFEKLTGYLQTWSAVQHFIREQQQNPLDLIHNDLKAAWGQDLIKTVKFPLLVRIGKTLS